jgi:hypothetical protein
LSMERVEARLTCDGLAAVAVSPVGAEDSLVWGAA